ncbi:fatty acid desaturase [Neisseria shayeganii]|uniref:Fatty acid desaturase n=1 Tax=Neisseria shayeganii TaxID=607712 RepID=A0A7D7N8G7_9NEIS|nr:fatty acid desaturase [Neisseria shayeganii]QMT41181.1 fatty acid desaturase [Neisseria shayeganii]
MTPPHPIPAQRNLLILTAASLLNFALLALAAYAPWPVAVPAALLFGLSNNTVFALLHECVHGVFSPHPTVNRWAGRWAALWFPTGFSVQRAFHLLHHRHNRSPAEQFDTLHPEDIRWLKYAQWYAIFSGLYWPVSVLGVLLYAFTPPFLRRLLNRAFGRQGSAQTSAEHYIGILDSLPFSARLEVWAALLFQLLLLWGLGGAWGAWLACYAAFGFLWSSLQYTDHAFSPFDNRNGAWNLRVPAWLRAVFLNYHLHLAHHQHPDVPWIHLPRYATPGPRFIDVWLACWRGPQTPERFPTFKQYPPL